MEGSVLDVLSPWKPADPLAMTVACHAAEVHTYSLVHCFGLSVGLRVEGGAHQELGARHSGEGLPECRCEHRVVVGDDGRQYCRAGA